MIPTMTHSSTPWIADHIFLVALFPFLYSTTTGTMTVAI